MEALHIMSDLTGQTLYVSVEDVANMEGHAELLRGRLVITDKTTPAHNNAVTGLYTALNAYIKKQNGDCKVFTENVALYCNELCDDKTNFFLPDIMVVCDKNGIKDDGIHTAPRFVAEVTSEFTRRNDYDIKSSVYCKIGVSEYWIVDLQKKLVIKNTFDGEVFLPEMVHFPNVSSLPVDAYPGLTIDFIRSGPRRPGPPAPPSS